MKRHFSRIGKPALAALLVGVVLLLDAMAACPALHKMIHKDAGKEDHDCAVTMFAHGKVESATVDVPVAIATVPIEATPQIYFPIFSPAIENLPQGRAPPAVSSPQV
jgi:hypothetical protein